MLWRGVERLFLALALVRRDWMTGAAVVMFLALFAVAYGAAAWLLATALAAVLSLARQSATLIFEASAVLWLPLAIGHAARLLAGEYASEQEGPFGRSGA